ncbi:MAG: hypothetical protein GY810_21860 [Aureispira sp.]|nr:hypothetical protein [Aureispira sp.]
MVLILGYTARTIKSKTRNALTDIESLLQKGLYTQTQRLLKRTKKIAVNYEMWEEHLQLIKYEFNLVNIFHHINEQPQHHKSLKTEMLSVLDKQRNHTDYALLNSETHHVFQRGRYIHLKNDPYYHTFIGYIQEHPLLQKADSAQSFNAAKHYYNIRSLFYEWLGDLDNSLDLRKALITLFEQYPQFKELYFDSYLNAINNYVLMATKVGNLEEAQLYLDKMNQLDTELNRKLNRKEHARLFRLHYNLLTDIYFKTQQYEKYQQLVPTIQEGLTTFDKEIDEGHKINFYYGFAYGAFLMGDIEQALHYLDEFIFKRSIEFSQDLLRTGRLLQIAAHFQLENFFLLPSIIRSTKRQIKKYFNTLSDVEKLVLDFFQRQPEADTKASMQELYRQLQELEKGTASTQLWERFHFPAWLKSQLNKQTLGKTLKDFALKK